MISGEKTINHQNNIRDEKTFTCFMMREEVVLVSELPIEERQTQLVPSNGTFLVAFFC